MMKTTLMNDVDDVLRRLAKLHHEASTGKKFEFPSQDPSGAFLASSYDSTLRQLNAYKSSLQQVDGTLKGYDSMLTQLTSAIHRVHALVVQASNDTNTAADRHAIADEIKRIREFIVQISNTKVGDSYLYSGAKSEVPVVTSGSGTNLTYYYVSNSATANANYLKVGTSTIRTNLTLPDIFNYNGTVSNSLLSYTTAGGTTLNTYNVTTDSAQTYTGAVEVDLKDGELEEKEGIINATLNEGTTLSYSGTTSVIIRFADGTIETTSGSASETLSAGASLTIVGGTVQLSGGGNVNVAAETSLSLINASGSSVTSLHQNTTSVHIKLGLLDKIIDDLENNDVAKVRGEDLGDLEKYESSLEKVTSDIGSREQITEELVNENTNFNTYITQLLSDTQDADMVKVISNIAMQENVYKAALESSARALLPTLADFLR